MSFQGNKTFTQVKQDGFKFNTKNCPMFLEKTCRIIYKVYNRYGENTGKLRNV